jgi:DNA-binding GntR family transcriptional regulator
MGERANSKAGQVYEAVKEAIVSGELEPGQFIDKVALCERLGVSRFPVSAAISRLAFERLVRVEPQHGSFVARISVEDVREQLFIRRALEGEIVSEAARRLSEEGRAEIAANLGESEAAAANGDRATLYALDVAFHALLTQHLGLHRSAEILDGVREHLERLRRVLLAPPGRMQATIAEHRAIFDAVTSGDPGAARSAMEAHMAAVTAQFELFLQTRPQLFSE